MAGQPLRLAIVASLDAKGVSAGAAETRREIESVADSAGKAASMTRLMAAANDEAAAAQRRAMDAARGRSAAELELQQSIARMTGIRPMLDDAGTSRRAADISAYGEALDDLRAKYNPLFAAERERERSLAAISQALRLGAISEDEHAQAVMRTDAAYRLQLASIAANDVPLARIGANTKLTAAEVTNLSYQLSDIAVMLASGQSPWLMMVQQGSQIGQIFGQRGLGMILPAVGAGLMSLVNPATLSLAAITALGYGASAAFAAMQGDIQEADGTLEDHLDLIDSVARRWAGALPGLQAYNDELRKTKDIEEALKALRIAGREQYEPVARQLPDLQIDMADVLSQLTLAGVDPAKINELQREFGELQARIADGTATGQDAIDVQRVLGGIADTNLPKMRQYADAFRDYAAAVEKSNEAAGKHRILPDDGVLRNWEGRTSVLPPLNPLDGYNRTPFQTEDEIMAERARRQQQEEENRRLGGLVPTPTRRPNLEDSLPSGRDLIATQREQMEMLRLEAALVTSGTAARERAIAAMRAEQEIRRLGIDSAGEEAEAIRSNAIAIADQTSALERNEEAWRKSQSAAESMIDSLIDRLSSGDIEGALEGLARDVSKELLGLGAGNTLKNALHGGDRPTLADYGGPLGYLGALAGRRPATMTPFAETGGGLLGMLGVDKPGAETIRVPAAPVDGNTVAAQAWNFFAGKGLAEHQVAGILGNIKAESAFDPKAIGDGGNAFGLFQHNDRRWKLFQHLGGMENLGNVQGQLEYAWKELQGPERRAYDALLGSRNVREATGAFAGFERPSGFSWANPEGAHNFFGRLRGAEEALAKFAGSTGGAVRDVDAMATSSIAAKDGIGALGTGAGQLGQNLARFFPQAPAPAGGGIGGWLSGLLGGGAPSFASMMAMSPMAAAAISAGRGGLYEVGGFTGFGNPKDAAGLVHREEYVFSAPAVRAIGVGNLDAMHRAAKHGYAEGGHAMPDSWRAPAGGGAGSGGGGGQTGVIVNLINQTGEPMRAEKRRTPDGRGGWRDEVVLRRAAIEAITGPEGKAAMGATYGMQATMPEL